MPLPHRINCGFCIENSSPYSQTYCKCYKVAIPYNLCGKIGLIYLCKGWVNYLMLHLDNYEAKDLIRVELAKAIRKEYPIFDDDECIIGSHFRGELMKSRMGDLDFVVTPAPYFIKLSMTPMFFIDKIMVEDMGLWSWESNYSQELSAGMNNYIERNMREIQHYNIQVVKDYINKNTGRFTKYQTLLDNLLQKTKQL